VLLVEQNAAQALQRASRAYVLEVGKVVMSGPAADLLDNKAVRAAYLGGDVTAAGDGTGLAPGLAPGRSGDGGGA